MTDDDAPGTPDTPGAPGEPLTPADACLRVLRDAAPESLHWTVVLDRALRARLLSPFTDPDVKGTVVRTLAILAKEGRAAKDGKGFYRLPDADADGAGGGAVPGAS